MSAPTYRHTVCLRPLEPTQRVVISQPADPTWPKDFAFRLLYCNSCQKIVPFDEVKQVLPGEIGG